MMLHVFKSPMLFACMVFLNGCGFAPLLDQQLEDKVAGIAIGKIECKAYKNDLCEGEFRFHLSHILNMNFMSESKEKAQYILDITYVAENSSLVMQPDTTAAMYKIRVVVSYNLKRVADDKSIKVGKVIAIDDYKMLPSPYANLKAENETYIQILNQVITDLKAQITSSI